MPPRIGRCRAKVKSFSGLLDGAVFAGRQFVIVARAAAVGSVLQLAGWVGALVNTYQLADKTWFVVLLIGGIIGLSFFLVAYAGVKVMPVTVLDANGLGQDSDVIAGVIWAADGTVLDDDAERDYNGNYNLVTFPPLVEAIVPVWCFESSLRALDLDLV